MNQTMTQQPQPPGAGALQRAEALTPTDRATVLYALCLMAPGPVLAVLDELDAIAARNGNGR